MEFSCLLQEPILKGFGTSDWAQNTETLATRWWSSVLRGDLKFERWLHELVTSSFVSVFRFRSLSGVVQVGHVSGVDLFLDQHLDTPKVHLRKWVLNASAVTSYPHKIRNLPQEYGTTFFSYSHLYFLAIVWEELLKLKNHMQCSSPHYQLQMIRCHWNIPMTSGKSQVSW